MANKITKREVINTMLADEKIKANPMYVEFLAHELELLNKKAEKKGKSEEELAEIARLKELITDVLATKSGLTVTEIQKSNVELAELSNQKVTSLLKAMKEDGLVERVVDGRKTLFSLK